MKNNNVGALLDQTDLKLKFVSSSYRSLAKYPEPDDLLYDIFLHLKLKNLSKMVGQVIQKEVLEGFYLGDNEVFFRRSLNYLKNQGFLSEDESMGTVTVEKF